MLEISLCAVRGEKEERCPKIRNGDRISKPSKAICRLFSTLRDDVFESAFVHAAPKKQIGYEREEEREGENEFATFLSRGGESARVYNMRSACPGKRRGFETGMRRETSCNNGENGGGNKRG